MSISPADALAIVLLKQDEYRKEALVRPKGKKGYDFGEAVGINKGLQMAIDTLIAAQKQESDQLSED